MMKDSILRLLFAVLIVNVGCGRDDGSGERHSNRDAQPSNPAVNDLPESGFALELFGQQFVEIPNLKYDGSHPLTMEARVLAKRVAHTSIVANFQGAGLGLEIDGKGHWAFVFHDGTRYRIASSDEPVVLNQPVHLAGVFDGSKLKLFVDGKLQKMITQTSRRHRASRFPLLVGADPHSTSPAEKFFIGIIDEVRISASSRYDKNFDPAPQPKSDDATMVLYHFDKGHGEVAQDSSDNSRHGKISGGDSWLRPKWGATSSKYKDFRQMLVAARETSGLTQADLAKKISRPKLFVERLEKGETKIDVVEFVEIAEAMGIDLGTFMKQLNK